MCGEELHKPGSSPGEATASSKAGFVMSIPGSQFEEAVVGCHHILHEHLELSPGQPEHQMEHSTKQWSVTQIISFNPNKSLIMSKRTSTAPWKLPVIFLPLVALLLIIDCTPPPLKSVSFGPRRCLYLWGNGNGNNRLTMWVWAINGGAMFILCFIRKCLVNAKRRCK
jgi:hypothetical protein